MDTLPRIGLVSTVFDFKPEGICTGRLARALLDYGFTVSLVTSTKSRVDLQHKQFTATTLAYGLREPRFLFDALAKLSKRIPNNFYLWANKVEDITWQASDMPDVFYGRAWPHASLVAAYQLAEKHNKPLVLHFSDPMPPSDAPVADKALLAGIQLMVDRADAITFTNQQTIDFQRRFIRFDTEKAHVLPHVTMPCCTFTETATPQLAAYIGTARAKIAQVDAMVEGFAAFNAANSRAQLKFVGTDAEYINRLKSQVPVSNIHCIDYVKDVKPEMQQAEVLVLVDPDVENPIVSSTKLLEYLGANRKVLGITPLGSPSDELLKRFPGSCVAVNDYNGEAIKQAYEQVFALKPDEQHYQTRAEAMVAFSPEKVAATFTGIISKLRSHV